MKQRTAGNGNPVDAMARQLAAAIESGDPGALFVVPSTAATLAAAATWIREAQWRVVGLHEEFKSSGLDTADLYAPARFLASCQEAATAGRRQPTVVFTDQFVSAEHAPLLVRNGAEEMFFPTLELVAAARYGATIFCWTGDRFVRPEAASSGAEAAVLRTLQSYYRACEALGDAWLMRGRQHQRSPAGRVDAARLRLRLYQSIVMLAPDDETSASLRLPLLEELIALQQRLPRVAAS